MKKLLPLTLLLLFSQILIAQKPPIKWGKISNEELDMVEYALDPEAEAVVLCDFGQISYEFTPDGVFYKMEHHRRVKLLKKSAFERGNVKLYFYDDKATRIQGLKAQVILPDGSKIKVSSKDIFEEQVNKFYKAKVFAFPQLEKGCIIEYKYSRKSRDLYGLEKWNFQEEIPVKHSELRTDIPEWYEYISINQGQPIQHSEKRVSRSIHVPPQKTTVGRGYNRESRMSSGNIPAKIVRSRYWLENAPALRPEPFITTMEDYYSSVRFQLQRIVFPGERIQPISNTWPRLAEELWQDWELFGGQLRHKKHYNSLLKAANAYLGDTADDLEKVMKIYAFISKNVRWNGYLDYSADRSLDDAFEKGKANSGELNLMLIALCRAHDIDALPVLVSTRDHGKMLSYYPVLEQFNHTLAFVQVGEQQMLLDVGNPNRDPSLLRANSLNYIGWLVDEKAPQWINLPQATNSEMRLGNFELRSNGTLSGELKVQLKGYLGMSGRDAYHAQKIKDEWLEKIPDLQITDSLKTSNANKVNKPFSYAFHCELSGQTMQAGEMLYVSPVIDGYSENPLKLEKRTFPVDIPVGRREQYIFNLVLPEGYAVEALPEGINLSLPENGGSFKFSISQTGNKLQLVSKIEIKQLHFEPSEYATLKNFFDIIVEKHAEQIVLKKTT